MPSIISTIGYITEANIITTSTDTTVTRGIIACNRTEENKPLFINFVVFNSKDKPNDSQLVIDLNSVYLIHGKFVYIRKKTNNENYEELQLNVMSAYKINIDTHDTPEQEVFISFQCTVLSVPLANNETISFKSEAVEFNGKIRTTIPITCVSSVYDERIFNKINKLQKGNKIEIAGNLIKNDKDDIVVSITYIVYANTNSYSTFDKKDLSRIPWLNSSKKTNEDQLHNTRDNIPNFILNHQKKETEEIENVNVDDDIVEISDDDKELPANRPKRKYTKKTKNSTIDNNKDNPSKRTRSKKLEDNLQNEVQSIGQQKTSNKKKSVRIKDLATQILENEIEDY